MLLAIGAVLFRKAFQCLTLDSVTVPESHLVFANDCNCHQLIGVFAYYRRRVTDKIGQEMFRVNVR